MCVRSKSPAIPAAYSSQEPPHKHLQVTNYTDICDIYDKYGGKMIVASLNVINLLRIREIALLIYNSAIFIAPQ